MIYIKKAMEDTFLRLSKEYLALLMTGPRQVGKTTMLQKLAQDENVGREYVTLDDLTERQMAKTDPKLFFRIHKPPYLLMRCSMRWSCSPTLKYTSTKATVWGTSGSPGHRCLS